MNPAGAFGLAASLLAGAAAGAADRRSKEPPVDIRGKRVVYSGKEGRAVFSGGVKVTRGASWLTSRELETLQGSNRAIARGEVRFHDAERQLDLACRELLYTHGLKHLHATGRCHLVVGERTDVSVVTADEMELEVDAREVVARGNVRILQADNEARCAQAHLYGREDRVVLTGSPVLRRPPHEFECERAETFFKQGRTVLSGRVRGRMVVEDLENLRQEAVRP